MSGTPEQPAGPGSLHCLGSPVTKAGDNHAEPEEDDGDQPHLSPVRHTGSGVPVYQVRTVAEWRSLPFKTPCIVETLKGGDLEEALSPLRHGMPGTGRDQDTPSPEIQTLTPPG